MGKEWGSEHGDKYRFEDAMTISHWGIFPGIIWATTGRDHWTYEWEPVSWERFLECGQVYTVKNGWGLR